MTTFSKEILSGATNGRNVKVAATATPGTTLHVADASAKDEVYLWAFNSDSVDRLLTLELGGTTDPDDLVEITIPTLEGLLLVLPGIPYTGGVTLRAFAAAANVIVITGFVNRIT